MRNLKKKTIERFIYTVEELSFKAKIPVTEAFRKIYERTGMEEIAEIISRIEKGESKVEVYRPYIPEETYILLKEGERRGISTSYLLPKYVEYMETYRELKGKFTFSLFFQLVYFSILSLAGWFLLSKIGENILRTGLLENTAVFDIIRFLYFPVNGTIAFFLLYTALYPDRVVKVNEAFREIEGVRILGLSALLLRAGSSIKDIIRFFSKDRKVGRYFVEREEGGIEDYINSIEKFLTPEEGAVLELAYEGGQLLEGMEKLISYKLSSAKKKVEAYVKQLQLFSIVLGVIPILMVLIGSGSLIFELFRRVLEIMRAL